MCNSRDLNYDLYVFVKKQWIICNHRGAPYTMETSISHFICEFKQLLEIDSKLKKRSG